jgi:hypothetical protein
MRFIIMSAVVLAAGLSLACGSGTAKQTPSPSAVSDQAFASAAKQAAKSTLITVGDFPSGWAGTPQDNSDNTRLGLTGDCAEFDDISSQINYPGAVAEAASDSFSSGGDASEDVSSDAGVFRTVALAAKSESHRSGLYRQCGSAIASALESQVRAEQGITEAHVTFDDAGTPKLGDDAVALDLSFSATGVGGSVAFVSKYIEVRVGQVIGSFSYDVDGKMTQEMADGLTRTLVERLTRAAATLPR